MKKLLIVLLAFFLFTACNSNENKEKLDSLYTELIAGHDEVMPLSMQQPKLKATIMDLLKGTDEDAAIRVEASEIMGRLQDSNDDMYTWMDDFATAMNDVQDKEEKIKLYEELKTEIVTVGEETKASIAAGKTFITEHE